MIGVVDEFGRALIKLRISSSPDQESIELTAWIDTAFNGELVVPQRIVESVGLEQSAGIRAKLADGTEVTLQSYSCLLHWFGEQRAVEVIANDGETPLLGIGLLLGRKLTVNYVDQTVTLI